jgi:Arf-GAP/SH3 domain/ANK repeat/PH domain-containing protein
LAAVKDNDVVATLYALALHGSPNTVDPATSLHVIFLALAAGDAMATVHENELAPSPSRDLSSVTFPVAELLLQNGADIPFPLPAVGLSLAAKNYLSQKTAKRLSASVGAVGGPVGSSGETQDSPPSLSLRERQQREKERLQKRISSGGRLHRATQLER